MGDHKDLNLSDLHARDAVNRFRFDLLRTGRTGLLIRAIVLPEIKMRNAPENEGRSISGVVGSEGGWWGGGSDVCW